MQVELVSPERILWSGQAEMVIARTVGGGDIAFLPGHAPFVGALGTGILTVRPAGGGADEKVAVHGGFVEVSGTAESSSVTVLSDVAEMASQIDVERARRAKEQAELHLRQEHDTEAEAALRRAHVRLEAAGHTPH
ncbi:ATP synthase F1 subunit epsilon [Acidimicrobiia bacterium EGI L10123]|uniref:ATP synthase F1 subunit epsilon n=1 Tax=Salinilacustrithrix flava TaxID=2957203 RepID=UPI003D7C14C6|nr:ATP synthase F1 subunit epsilon [Acidimicrobiia bacterium EGI L10123]